jgi:hypothetical protein
MGWEQPSGRNCCTSLRGAKRGAQGRSVDVDAASWRRPGTNVGVSYSHAIPSTATLVLRHRLVLSPHDGADFRVETEFADEDQLRGLRCALGRECVEPAPFWPCGGDESA